MEKWKNSVLFAIVLLVVVALVGSAQAQHLDLNASSISIFNRPDLTVSSITINPGDTRGEDIIRVYVNESNNISAVVWNNGTADAGAFDVCFNVIGFEVSRVNVAGLSIGANTTVSINWTPYCGEYPVMPYYLVMPSFPAQSHATTINVTADCNEEIDESDEMNNMLSKFIPAIQVYSGYDVIGGVVNNGYKSKNFDCNTTEEPLTLFEYDSEIVGGGIVYNVSGVKITLKPTNTSTRVHHIEIPDGATVKKARLYVYWYDKWGNYKTYPTGCLANLSVNFSGTEFMPDVKYNDQKGFGYYHSPKGTYAYDVTSKVTGSGDYTAIVENIDPANSTSLLGEMLYVAYEGASGNRIQLWTLEGNDYLMAADDTHNKYNYCVSPEEATATVSFPGSIDLANVINATLVTVVAQGRTTGMDMLFNDNVVKKDAWDSPTEAYPDSKICTESVDVTANLTSNGNNMGFLDNGTDGMQASNAFLVIEYKTKSGIVREIEEELIGLREKIVTQDEIPDCVKDILLLNVAKAKISNTWAQYCIDISMEKRANNRLEEEDIVMRDFIKKVQCFKKNLISDELADELLSEANEIREKIEHVVSSPLDGKARSEEIDSKILSELGLIQEDLKE